MILIIAEKPSVGRDIAAVVGADQQQHGYREGNGYLVSWCIGHLVDSAAPETYDPAWREWSLNNLPILPDTFRFTISDGTKKQFDTLQRLMSRSDVDSLICATDAGREGENIFRLVYQAAGCGKPWKRLWTSSLEPRAIQVALDHMLDGHAYDDLADAALCRQQADWLFGINLTRLYTCLYGAKLNTGRVQSPTLALIVQRQERIDHFQPTPYFIVSCRLADRFDVQHRFETADAAAAFLASKPEQATISKIASEVMQVSAPRLYDLVSLQQEANRLFGYTAKQTLADMQVLYEAHLATYPRTDSRYITADMEFSVRQMTIAFQTAGILPKSTDQMDFHRLVDDGKVNDHPALLPTASLTPAKLDALPTSQKRLMTLLVYRLLEAAAPAYQYCTVTVDAQITGEIFSAQAKTMLDPGWKTWRDACIAALAAKKDTSASESNDFSALSGIEEGEQLPITSTSQEKKMTKPPTPYTEAALLSAMETAGRSVTDETLREAMRGKGLGTAATRAAIIESLVSNGYITREKRYLIPTEKAKTYLSVLIERLKDPVMTAEWESKLLDIERGQGDSEQFIAEVKTFLGHYIGDIKRFYRPELYENVFSTEAKSGRASVGSCPLCGGSVLIYAKTYGCSNFRSTGCKFSIWKTIAGKQLPASVVRSLLEDKKTKTLKGFQRKDGTTFDAALELHDDGSIGFVRKAAKK